MQDLTCRQARDLATDSLEGPLTPDEAESLSRHLASCRTCPGLHRSLLLVMTALGGLSRRPSG